MLLRAAGFPASVIQGFSTRQGGVSQGRFESMNLGGRWGDDPDAVAENLRRLAVAGGFDPAALIRVRQVHGVEVVAAHEARARADGPQPAEADGLWHHVDHPWTGPGPVLGVMTADCVPLLLVDGDARAAAAVHSGWRGTAGDIAGRAVTTLVEQGGVPVERLHAAIGPCIEVEAFEVGEEVAAHFDPRFVARAGYPKPHVDLAACVRAQLEAAGVPANQIERVGGCTHASVDLYFSYRRDGAGIGQHLSFVGLPPR
jgi:YfiH family protein